MENSRAGRSGAEWVGGKEGGEMKSKSWRGGEEEEEEEEEEK